MGSLNSSLIFSKFQIYIIFMTEVVLETVWLLFIYKKIIGGFEMIELVNLEDLEKVEHLPQELREVIADDLAIFSAEYGSERNYKVEGGYVAIIEKVEDYLALREHNLDFAKDDIITEYTDEFGAYTACLILLGDDYNLVIVAPKELGDFEKVRKLLRDR